MKTSAVGLPEDKAYLLHHFNCPYCISAGATPGKQERCPDGLQLWDATTKPPGHNPRDSMQTPKLSRAQRTMLHNAVHGRPIGHGLKRNSTSHKTSSTLQALHRAGMLAGVDHQPTEAGRAYFALPEQQKAPQES